MENGLNNSGLDNSAGSMCATPADNSRQYMTMTQYARHRGVSQPRLSAMVKAGQLEGAYLVEDNGRYRIDVTRADAIIEQVRDPRHDARFGQQSLFTGQPQEMPRRRPRAASLRLGGDTLTGAAGAARLGPDTLRGGGKNAPSYTDAAAVEKAYKAQLARLEYEKRLGALVPKEEIDRQAQAVGRLIRTRLEAIPNKLAPTVAGLTSPLDVAEHLKKEINQLLTDLSNDVSGLPFG